MRLTYNGTIYRIGFRHGSETNSFPGLGTLTQDYTMAFIRTGEKDESAENIAASAKIHRFHKDAPSLETARKNALRKALQSMNATQDFRTAIWAAYHSRPGGLKANTAVVATTSSSAV